jgi:hypothetical protein
MFRTLDFGFDSRVHRSIVQKRQALSIFSMMRPNVIDSEFRGRIFDQLLIVGAPRQRVFESPPDPTILLVYPASPLILEPDEFRQVPSFCFPYGLQITDDRHLVLDLFVFEITSARQNLSHVYGVCTIISLANARDFFFFNSASKVYPTCICYLTTSPMFTPIFQYSIFLAKWISGAEPSPVIHNDCPTEASRFESVALLPGMVLAGQAMRTDGYLIPRVFIVEVAYMRSLLAQPLQSTGVKLAKSDSLNIPPREMSPRAIPYIALDALFSCLSIANIVRAVSALLLERHIIVVSRCVNALTMSVLCLKELCKPFNLRCTFLPILPETPEFVSFLDSPVPYILGILRHGQRIAVAGYVVVVDLDADTITDTDKSPLLPGGAGLIDRLKALIDHNRADVLMPPRPARGEAAGSKGERQVRIRREWAEFVRARMHPLLLPFVYSHYSRRYILSEELIGEIAAMFASQIEPSLEELLRPCFITDTTDIDSPVTVFNKELFLASVDPADKPFYTAFVHTTAFQDFSDSLMDETARSATRRRTPAPPPRTSTRNAPPVDRGEHGPPQERNRPKVLVGRDNMD